MPSGSMRFPDGRGAYAEYDPVELDWIATQLSPRGAPSSQWPYPRAPTALGAMALAVEMSAETLPDEVRAECARLEDVVRCGQRFACPCCQNLTLYSTGMFDICPVCNWEDDPVDLDHPEQPSGPNGCSLAEGRASYASIGASTRDALERKRVRAPLPRERPQAEGG